INSKFEDEIRHSIKILREMRGIDFFFEFSEQDESTNSVAFDVNNEIIYDKKGNPITRPAGHGVLLHNLNKIDADLILIRNIDNIQHQENSKESTDTRKMLSGVLLEFQSKIFNIINLIDENKDYSEQVNLLN